MNGSTVSMLWIVIGAVVGVAGLALLVWAWRGDRAKGRRRCPKCWYDLGSTEGLRCPECGRVARSERDLARPRRQRKLAVVGLIVMLVGAASAAWPGAWTYDWNRLMPVSWLVRDGRLDTPGGAAARAELARRVRTGRLKGAALGEFVDTVLEIQADPDAHWSAPAASPRGWGAIIDEAWLANGLDREQIERFGRGAFDPFLDLAARERAQAGAPVPVAVRLAPPRSSPDWMKATNVLALRGRLRALTIDGTPWNFDTHPPQWKLLGLAALAANDTVHDASVTRPSIELEPGLHTVIWDWEFVVRRESFQQSRFVTQEEVPDGALATWTRRFTTTIEVVEGSSLSITDDDTVRRAVESAILSVRLDRVLTTMARQPLLGRISFDALPVGLCADVFVRTPDGREMRLATITVAKGQPDARAVFHCHDADIGAETTKVDVILRTNREAAEESAVVIEVWDGEIVIEDVTIR